MEKLRRLATSGPFHWIRGARTENLEPRTGSVLSEVRIGNEADVEEAVQASREAFPAWKALPSAERGRILTKTAEVLRSKLEEIALMDVLDNGKPIWEARMDMESVLGALEYYGAYANNGFAGEHYKLPGGKTEDMENRDRRLELSTANRDLEGRPALAAGNTFVYKPSQFTPLTALYLAEALKTSGLPDGVFNVLQGEGATGAELSQHPGVSKLSFTGSVATGTKIMAAGAQGIRPSPLIIFNDADLVGAVKGALMANFFSQGQVCSNGTRVFVQRGIYEAFMKEFIKQVKGLKVGDPFLEDTTVGATIHGQHAENVLAYVQGAKEEGAKIEGDLKGGHYISPCILSNLKDSFKCVREEIFGPVAAVLPFDSEEEVVGRANDTPFVADGIEAGVIWVNTFNVCSPEMSGIGRENGKAVMEYYTQTKTTYVEGGEIDCGLLYKE
ncbi:4trimethylaminobutyraldehyde dehydrogenaselike [Caligus rogercresseyi]|uniref:4trimethylaminobutyraldehyde dehydrogenaselike n=1 Tax=Caligus rogercresseyi TaxID=217165 RepID=A0A7T8GZ37_CALRO|nr:4trimethylaminobutyraldehyde dehydrogenaselike [Caligus rogercresseyi]